MSRIPYRKRMKVEDDKQQAKFSIRGETKLTEKTVVKLEARFSMTEKFACPFCLGLHPLQRYLISTKHGIHQGLGQCPECSNKFRFTTLTAKMTPEEYAEFAYPYARSGFWQKVPWNKWKERMQKIGWSQRFWQKYHELKGEDKESDVLSEFEERQLRWAQEAGLIK